MKSIDEIISSLISLSESDVIVWNKVEHKKFNTTRNGIIISFEESSLIIDGDAFHIGVHKDVTPLRHAVYSNQTRNKLKRVNSAFTKFSKRSTK